MSWSFLVRPSDDPGTVGLLSLRLETTWFGTPDSSDGDIRAAPTAAPTAEPTAASPSPEGTNESGDWDQAGEAREGPVQWCEDKAVEFIQVSKGWKMRVRLFHLFLFCFVYLLSFFRV